MQNKEKVSRERGRNVIEWIIDLREVKSSVELVYVCVCVCDGINS